MNSKVLLSLFIFLFSSFFALGQEVKIKGKVSDGKGKTPLEFSNIALMAVKRKMRIKVVKKLILEVMISRY